MVKNIKSEFKKLKKEIEIDKYNTTNHRVKDKVNAQKIEMYLSEQGSIISTLKLRLGMLKDNVTALYSECDILREQKTKLTFTSVEERRVLLKRESNNIHAKVKNVLLSIAFLEEIIGKSWRLIFNVPYNVNSALSKFDNMIFVFNPETNELEKCLSDLYNSIAQIKIIVFHDKCFDNQIEIYVDAIKNITEIFATYTNQKTNALTRQTKYALEIEKAEKALKELRYDVKFLKKSVS